MEIFRDREQDYRDWIESHPDGYVLNVDKAGARTEYPMLHHSSHRQISAATASAYTTGDYFKVCSEHLEELVAWSEANAGRPPNWCEGCLAKQEEGHQLERLLRRGATVSDLLLKAGMKAAYIQGNRTFASRWAWDDGTIIVATVWKDSLNDLNDRPWVEFTDFSERTNLTSAQHRRAKERHDILSKHGGRPIRVILQTQWKDEKGGVVGQAEKRGLDPIVWSASSAGGRVRLTRAEATKKMLHQGGDWTEDELRAAVSAYIEMREKSRTGEPFTKKAYYDALAVEFGRSPKAFEFRMQNISHVLELMGRPWLPGLVPARNVGANVAARIEGLIASVEGKYVPPVAAFAITVREASKKSKAAPTGVARPRSTNVVVTQYARDPAVKAWVLRLAKGFCECCRQAAPFETADGPFLEVHHLRLLAENGSDTICNAVAICPNCHRRLHYGLGAEAIIEELYTRISRLRRTSPSQANT